MYKYQMFAKSVIKQCVFRYENVVNTFFYV